MNNKIELSESEFSTLLKDDKFVLRVELDQNENITQMEVLSINRKLSNKEIDNLLKVINKKYCFKRLDEGCYNKPISTIMTFGY